MKLGPLSYLSKILCLSVLWALTAVSDVSAHCQVPCGIYDDAARILSLKEDTATMEKAVKELGTLATKNDAQSKNQFARWVLTKEQHASNVIAVVSEYFLTQKVKPQPKAADAYTAYLNSLAEHHAVMVAAMKVKQSVDVANVEKLKAAIAVLEKRYGAHAH